MAAKAVGRKLRPTEKFPTKQKKTTSLVFFPVEHHTRPSQLKNCAMENVMI